jgi:hypothetical protein
MIELRARLSVVVRALATAVAIDVRVDFLGALVQLLRTPGLGLRTVRALLGLSGLAAGGRGLLVRRRTLTLRPRFVQARIGAVLVRVCASLFPSARAGPLGRHEYHREQYHRGNYQHDHKCRAHRLSSLGSWTDLQG